MNINKLKLLLSAIVCTVNTCNTYAISNTNVNTVSVKTVSVETVSREYFQQNRDGVKLSSTGILTINNASNFKPSELDISDDLNKSFYIPPSVDVLGQPIEEPKEHMTHKVQLSNPIWQQIENEEYNLERNIKIDWRVGHTYRQTVSNVAHLRASLLQKQDK